ncbi:MAG: glycosyltransferase family 4 protein [Gammaproteobacteria bacterium]
MNILHLVAGEKDGGATRGAYWLHLALRELGVQSTMLSSSVARFEDDSVVSVAGTPRQRLKLAVSRRLGQLPLKLYPHRKGLIFSTGLGGAEVTKHPAFRRADLIHLHWVTGLVKTSSLSSMNKPVVWTLRDMWPFTGGCHYALDCERYREACGRCPQLGSTAEHDLSRLLYRRKAHNLPEHLRVIGISRWLSGCAERSGVFRDHRVSTISNNVDTDVFTPIDKSVARRALGLDQDEKVILVGARNVADFYKGFDLFLEALPGLAGLNIRLLSFGRTSVDIPEYPGIAMTHLGFLSDALALRLAYSAATVFVAPSRMEAFGKTIVEAMACGTPVVCFDATGPKDIVRHQRSGYLARAFSASDLVQGVRWVLERPAEAYEALCAFARDEATSRFDARVIARAYLEVYEEMLGIGPVIERKAG